MKAEQGLAPKPGGRNVLGSAVALSLGVAVALGLARFAYALLLPPMKADLGWSYALAGGMNAANAAGYLFGALAAAPVMAGVGTKRSFVGALLVTALSLLFSGFPSGYAALAALRFASGASGAVVFVAGGVLASHLAPADADGSVARPAAGTVLAVYFGGGGLGILASGLGVPALLELGSAGAWRWAWAALGAASLLALIPAVRAASGLEEPPGRSGGDAGRWSARPLLPTFSAYFLFAFGYIAYMTFAVALLAQGGAGALETSLFWAVLGVSAAASAFLWGRPIERLRGGRALGAVLAVVAAGALLPLLSGSATLAFASAVLFGGSFLAVPTAVTAIARRSLPARSWSGAISALTVVFAAGQCFGPVVSGALSDAEGGLQTGLRFSAGVLLAATVIALLQKSLHPAAATAEAKGGSVPEGEDRGSVAADGPGR
jgi:predicted MFS family arabinose efflux permease